MHVPILPRFRTLQRLALAAAAALLWAEPAHAQQRAPAAIDLRVIDGETGAPLSGASVRLDGVSAGVSDARGTLRLPLVPAGTHRVEVAMLGRHTAAPEVDLAPGYALSLEVVLEPNVVPLPPVEVIARSRAPRGGVEGNALDEQREREALLAALEVHAQAVKELSTPVRDPLIPQVRGRELADPTGDGATDAGDGGVCVPDLFVDGVPVAYTGAVYLGDLAQPEHDPRDGPPQFGEVTSECGAILIWTDR
ncbi:MAG TPA: carboxypeptidase regulatory-like domain-containing protein [Longimicrobium sp.]|nr:carboxypeptidase regulatory-like domain-containing protein [Longimicrobium sp.]